MRSLEQDVEFFLVDGPGYTEDEAYAFLAGVGRETSTLPPLVAAANEGHTGAMIALVPSDRDVKRLALKGGEKPEQLHLTLAFLGEAKDITEKSREQILNVARRYAKTPIDANAFAVNVFNPRGDEPCVVLGVGNGDLSLETLRSNVVSAVGGMAGFTLPEQHTPWVPHVTIAYTDDFSVVSELADRTGAITFDKVRVAFGDEVTDIPLTKVVEPITAAGDWNPHEHPRGHDGKFIEKLDRGNAIFKMATSETFAGQTDYTPAQREAIHGYTDKGYKSINPALRNPSLLGKLQAGKIKTIKSAMSSIRQNVSAFRKAPFHVFGVGDGDFDTLNDLVGKTFVDHGFMSTSIDDRFNGKVFPRKEFVTMELHVPKGTRAAYIADVSAYKNERELLLDAGVKFKVKKYMMTADGPYIVAEVVDQ